MKYAIAAIALVMATPAHAGDYASEPIAAATDLVTYAKGTPAVTRETDSIVVTVVPMEAYFGRPSFYVEVFNKTQVPFNFGTESITVSAEGEKKPTEVYTREELEDQAQNRAMWAGVVAGLAGMSSGYSSYSSTTHTPYGSYRTTGSYYNTALASYRTDRLMSGISAGLEQRLADARNNALQKTTVQPGEGYGGRIVLSKPKAKFPVPVTLNIMGEVFHFQMDK